MQPFVRRPPNQQPWIVTIRYFTDLPMPRLCWNLMAFNVSNELHDRTATRASLENGGVYKKRRISAATQ
jgi:hypothetical protein